MLFPLPPQPPFRKHFTIMLSFWTQLLSLLPLIAFMNQHSLQSFATGCVIDLSFQSCVVFQALVLSSHSGSVICMQQFNIVHGSWHWGFSSDNIFRLPWNCLLEFFWKLSSIFHGEFCPLFGFSVNLGWYGLLGFLILNHLRQAYHLLGACFSLFFSCYYNFWMVLSWIGSPIKMCIWSFWGPRLFLIRWFVPKMWNIRSCQNQIREDNWP